MADEPDNLVLVHFRRIDERLAGLEREFTLRLTGLEASMASLEARFAGLEVRLVALEARLDATNHRLDRIERRLDLADTPV
jgi:hypothetical protein